MPPRLIAERCDQLAGKMRTLFLLGLLLNLTILAYGQEEYKKYFNDVLRDRIIDSTFVFNTDNDAQTTIETTLTYLGVSKSGIKVIYATESFPTSATRHGFRGLFIVDTKGNRYWYRDINQPEKMRNGLLYFKYADKSKKFYYYTVDLNKEIPKFICIDKGELDCYDYQTHM